MTETIACAVERFIAHKRAHGRKYHSEARELVLLVRFAAEHQVSCLDGLTPALLEDFLASRPRPHPRSFNHLLLPGAENADVGGVHDANGEPDNSGGVVDEVPVHVGEVPD